ncbi:hypothetical protein EWM64_g4596 [Hericium alpestre]|uniref:Major facilitator superfamily (MFS) profile domain-containing protein n=1 Tax=Hericium alpestre TaxID=135208 RepID=A0A4Y9ZYY7_9AGAM|nr:hypothetical protein EWM64_g4596 [Hericium alpestre]
MLSDRFGRKWPLVVNLLLCAAFELGSSFVQTFNQFLATRCLFGIAMGGIWGLASSTALENLPAEARGFGSGVVQLGYACGNMIAAIVNLKLVTETGQWHVLFWTAAGISGAAAGLRAVLPESETFLKARAKEKAQGGNRQSRKAKIFARETWAMLKNHWSLCIYAVLLLTGAFLYSLLVLLLICTEGYNFLSHGSQDLYPTYLQTSKNFDSDHASIATIIAECGAIACVLPLFCHYSPLQYFSTVGAPLAAFSRSTLAVVSQYFGRCLVMIIFNVLIGVFIPLWIIPSSFSALSSGAFCVQFGVQGTWGVIPIYLTELARRPGSGRHSWA